MERNLPTERNDTRAILLADEKLETSTDVLKSQQLLFAGKRFQRHSSSPAGRNLAIKRQGNQNIMLYALNRGNE